MNFLNQNNNSNQSVIDHNNNDIQNEVSFSANIIDTTANHNTDNLPNNVTNNLDSNLLYNNSTSLNNTISSDISIDMNSIDFDDTNSKSNIENENNSTKLFSDDIVLESNSGFNKKDSIDSINEIDNIDSFNNLDNLNDLDNLDILNNLDDFNNLDNFDKLDNTQTINHFENTSDSNNTDIIPNVDSLDNLDNDNMFKLDDPEYDYYKDLDYSDIENVLEDETDYDETDFSIEDYFGVSNIKINKDNNKNKNTKKKKNEKNSNKTSLIESNIIENESTDNPLNDSSDNSSSITNNHTSINDIKEENVVNNEQNDSSDDHNDIDNNNYSSSNNLDISLDELDILSEIIASNDDNDNNKNAKNEDTDDTDDSDDTDSKNDKDYIEDNTHENNNDIENNKNNNIDDKKEIMDSNAKEIEDILSKTFSKNNNEIDENMKNELLTELLKEDNSSELINNKLDKDTENYGNNNITNNEKKAYTMKDTPVDTNAPTTTIDENDEFFTIIDTLAKTITQLENSAEISNTKSNHNAEDGKSINILINKDDIFSISILNETYEIVADFDGISVLSENINISTPKKNFYVTVGEKYIEIHNTGSNFAVNTNFEDIEFANAINNVTFAKKDNIIELNIKEAFKLSSVNNKVELSMLNTSVADMKSSNIETSETINEASICDNRTLLISEETQKVYLPYTIEELMQKLNNSDEYQTLEDVIENEYTVPLSTFKMPIVSRFKEAYKFMRTKEHSSVYAALDLAIELMFNSNLNPAVIRASKDLKELNVYLDCLYENEIDKFDCFKIVYKVLPKIK